jgi:hypothetical protein
MIRLESLLFLLILVASLAVYKSAAFVDPGTFWHTRCGQIMLDERAIIETDRFTEPFDGQPWRPQQWLAEIGMALLYRAGGWDAQLLAFATLLAGVYSWAIARLREAGVPLVFAILAAAAVWFGAFFHAFVRPHMVTILLTAWVLARLIDFDRGRVGLKGLAWFIPVNILWTNIHGGVLGGLMMLALCGAGWLIALAVGRSSPLKSWRDAGFFCALCLLAAAAPVVNPYGTGMFAIWSKIVGSSAMKQYVVEHQPLDWRDGAGQWVIAVSLAYLLFLAVAVVRTRNVRVVWLMPVLWFALSSTGIRQGPLAMATALVALADVWPRALPGLTVVAPAAYGRRWLIVPLLVVLAAFVVRPWGWIGGIAKHDDNVWPVSLLPDLERAAANVPAGSAIYNDTYFGGFLIWHAPAVKIFMDDRFELCGDDWLRAYCTGGPAEFDAWDRQYGFRLALLQSNAGERSALDIHLTNHPARWRLVARHPKAALFEKVGN